MVSYLLISNLDFFKEEEEIEWLVEQLEKLPSKSLSDETKVRILNELLLSQSFDQFMAKKFQSVKRYGAEGAESMMAFYSTIFRLSAQGMLHFLNNIRKKNTEK